MSTSPTNPAPPLSLADSHVWCRASAKHHAKSFYFASIALPVEKKQAAYAVYAFCRYADDLVDRAEGDGVALALETIKDQFDRIASGEDLTLPFAPAFAWAVQRFGLVRQPFLDLLKGVAMDLGPVRIGNWEELDAYCYHVASVVGLIMARIFELNDPAAEARAIELGTAMQLTNILRDVKEDLELGRVYLPATELAEFGVTESMLNEWAVTPEFQRFMRFQIARARDLYQHSEQGIGSLANDGSQLTVWLMRTVYAGILDEIERQDLDVFRRRAATSKFRKLQLAWKTWRCWKKDSRQKKH